MTNPVDWQLKLTRQAERDLKKLSRSDLSRVYAELNKLKVDPSLGESLSGELAGARSLHFTLRGSGQHRAAYFCITADNTVLVFAIGSRENFYREARRRISSIQIDWL